MVKRLRVRRPRTEAGPSPPAADLVEVFEDDTGRRLAAAIDLVTLQKLIGRDIVVGLMRCGVWVDRLMSLAWLGDRARRAEHTAPEQSVRDLATMTFLGCGCVHELGRALRSIEAAGVDGLIRPDDVVEDLRALLARWEGKSVFVRVRDKGGFHVDEPVLRRGLRVIEQLPGTRMYLSAEIGQHEVPNQLYQRHPLAMQALIAGLFVPLAPEDAIDRAKVKATFHASGETFSRFLKELMHDYFKAADLVTDLAVACFAGAKAGRRPSPATPVPRPPAARAELEAARQALRAAARGLPGFDYDAPLVDQVRRLGEELRRLRASHGRT